MSILTGALFSPSLITPQNGAKGLGTMEPVVDPPAAAQVVHRTLSSVAGE